MQVTLLHYIYFSGIILTNAKPYISTETVRVFAKYGDIKQAERDFLSLQPVKIRDFGVGLSYFILLLVKKNIRVRGQVNK